MNETLLKFWHQLNFNVVRIGFTREQTSGEHASIMLLPLSEKGIKVNHEAISRFNGQLAFWFDDVLKDISIKIKKSFTLDINDSLELTKSEKKDLYSFIHFSRNYELCISSLSKIVMANKNNIAQGNIPEDFRQVLNEKVVNKLSWKELGKKLNLNGQDDARKLFQRAIIFLVEE